MLDSRGFTVHRARPRRDGRVRRLLIACALGVCTLAMVAAPTFTADQPVEAWRGNAKLSDMGFPMPVRPDERTEAGIPIKAGNVWDARAVGCLSDHRIRTATQRIADRTIRAFTGSDDAARACRTLALYVQILAMPLKGPPTHWLGDRQVGEWAWLFRQGAAGWRSLERAIETGGTARDHWDVYRGLTAGFVLGPTGFTIYTQDPGGTTYYCSATGSNLNDGLSPGAPLLTPSVAASKMTSGQADWCLFKAGDAFVESAGGEAVIGSFTKLGKDVQNPMRFDRYGTGTRPSFDIKQRDNWLNPRIGSGKVHIGSVEVFTSNNDGHGSAQIDGIDLSDNFTDGQVENCYVHDVVSGITCQAGAGNPDRVTFRRNIIQNCWYIDNAQKGVGLFCQGFTQGLLVEENLFDHNGWHPTAAGSVKTEFRHNTYITDTNQGYTGRRNISTRASSHGLGRCHGKVYHNIVQDCPVSILFSEDAAHFAGVSDEIYQNSIVGRTDDDSVLFPASGISVYEGIDAHTTETLLDIYDNTISGYPQDGSTLTVYSMALSSVATVGGTLKVRNNCIYNVHNTSNIPTAAIRLNAGSYTHQLTGNKTSTTGQMIWQFGSISTAGYVLSISGNTWFNPGGQANTFFDDANGMRSYAQWLTDSGETSSTFADPMFPDPTRDLSSYNSAVLSGIATLAAAVTRIQAYDVDTWTDAEHGVYPRLNYIRQGFGLAAVTDPYAGSTPPPPPSGTDATPVLPGLWDAPTPTGGVLMLWGSDGQWHSPNTLIQAATAQSNADIVAALNQIRDRLDSSVVPALSAMLVELRIANALRVQAWNLSESPAAMRSDPDLSDVSGDVMGQLLAELRVANQIDAILSNQDPAALAELELDDDLGTE